MNTDLEFHKSSYSGHGQDCVEVAQIPANFRKSSYSGVNGNCVEVGSLPCGAAVRDSKNPAKGHLPFPAAEWDAFLSTAKL
ncbi:DUF397 domain-containing protein [Nocardiopsis lucentensis]|uniref:DUF397 domain-containing protein n=1 Tax=Nocardiopsis lucentensis TaxID=53441 RepID=UPI000348E996|nr:DUF397 domain-containing protein [Nocardiopsis lucentensis]